MAKAPVVTELPTQSIRFLFGTPFDLKRLPTQLRNTGRAEIGEFMLVGKFPEKHSKTPADQAAYLARHEQMGSGLFKIYHGNPYKLDKVDWVAGSNAGVHLLTKDKYGQILEFPTVPSKSKPGRLHVLVSEYVQSNKDPAVTIRASGFGGHVKPTDDPSIVTVVGYPDPSLTVPKSMYPEVDKKYHKKPKAVLGPGGQVMTPPAKDEEEAEEIFGSEGAISNWNLAAEQGDLVMAACSGSYRKDAETFEASQKQKSRKGPTISATKRKVGTRMRGNDGKMWEVKKAGKSQRWMAGAETFNSHEYGDAQLGGDWVSLDPLEGVDSVVVQAPLGHGVTQYYAEDEELKDCLQKMEIMDNHWNLDSMDHEEYDYYIDDLHKAGLCDGDMFSCSACLREYEEEEYSAESIPAEVLTDALIQWEDDGYSSASIPPDDIFWAEDTLEVPSTLFNVEMNAEGGYTVTHNAPDRDGTIEIWEGPAWAWDDIMETLFLDLEMGWMHTPDSLKESVSSVSMKQRDHSRYLAAETFEAASGAYPELDRDLASLERQVATKYRRYAKGGSVTNAYKLTGRGGGSAVVYGPQSLRFGAPGTSSNKFFVGWVYQNKDGSYTALSGWAGLGRPKPQLGELGTFKDRSRAVAAVDKKMASKNKKGYFKYDAEGLESAGKGFGYTFGGIMGIAGGLTAVGLIGWLLQPILGGDTSE